MLYVNQYSHIPLLADELKQLLPDGSFASRLWQSIGREWHYRLVEWPFEDEIEYSSLFPVDSLFAEVTKNGGLDPEWLASDDGSYLDDDGEMIPPTVKPTYSAIEQLAAYGLWLISDLIYSYGPIPDEDDRAMNDYGWGRGEVIEHYSACMLLAYQALSYSKRILQGISEEEIRNTIQLNFAAMGKAGAVKRHAPMATLRAWAIEKYQAGKWSSANQAAHDLQCSVVEHGRTIGAHLTKANAQRTIAEWIRKSV